MCVVSTAILIPESPVTTSHRDSSFAMAWRRAPCAIAEARAVVDNKRNADGTPVTGMMNRGALAIQQTGERARRSSRGRDAEQQSDADEPRPLANHKRHHRARRCAERDANADLPRPLIHGVRDGSVEADPLPSSALEPLP